MFQTHRGFIRFEYELINSVSLVFTLLFLQYAEINYYLHLETLYDRDKDIDIILSTLAGLPVYIINNNVGWCNQSMDVFADGSHIRIALCSQENICYFKHIHQTDGSSQ